MKWKLPQDKSKDPRPGWKFLRLPIWLVGKDRMAVVEQHDKICEDGSNAQKFITADEQAEAFERQIWEVQGRKHRPLGDFMSFIVETFKNFYWDGPKK